MFVILQESARLLKSLNAAKDKNRIVHSQMGETRHAYAVFVIQPNQFLIDVVSLEYPLQFSKEIESTQYHIHYNIKSNGFISQPVHPRQ